MLDRRMLKPAALSPLLPSYFAVLLNYHPKAQKRTLQYSQPLAAASRPARQSADGSEDRSKFSLSSGGPEGDGKGLCLVTYWPNK